MSNESNDGKRMVYRETFLFNNNELKEQNARLKSNGMTSLKILKICVLVMSLGSFIVPVDLYGQILPISPTEKRKQKGNRSSILPGSAHSSVNRGRNETKELQKKQPLFNLDVTVLFQGTMRPSGGIAWLKELRENGCQRTTMRVRKSTDQLGIRISGSDKSTKIVVLEVQGGQLVTPSGRLRITEKRKIKAWVDSLRYPPEEPKPEMAAFGLNEVELVAVHLKMNRPVKSSTLGKKAEEIILEIRKSIPFPLKLGQSQIQQILEEEVPEIQLKGVSSGTALASFLRPYGLVFYPKKSPNGRVTLIVETSGKAKEYWPVGWPARGLPIQRAPKIFEVYSPAPAIKTIEKAMFDISESSGVPILMDHNTLLPSGFDSTERKSIFKGKKTDYRSAVGLWWKKNKRKPIIEIRLDEAEHPFLWISGNQ